MVFIDFENFRLSLNHYAYKLLALSKPIPLDYAQFPHRLVDALPGQGNRLVKTFLFAPKPDDFLMQDTRRKKMYEWLKGMNNNSYFDLAEGKHIARLAPGAKYMNIADRTSYYVIEKGTDVLLSTHVITKAFLNAFDTAIIVSGDTDNIPIFNVLNTMGKTSVCVGVYGQILDKLREHADDVMILDDKFFATCSRYDNAIYPQNSIPDVVEDTESEL